MCSYTNCPFRATVSSHRLWNVRKSGGELQSAVLPPDAIVGLHTAPLIRIFKKHYNRIYFTHLFRKSSKQSVTGRVSAHMANWIQANAILKTRVEWKIKQHGPETRTTGHKRASGPPRSCDGVRPR